jgi:hypothetical protein
MATRYCALPSCLHKPQSMKIWLVTIFLVFGIGNTVVTKVADHITAQGSPEFGIHKFQKPWFLTSLLFFAMFCGLPVYAIFSFREYRRGNIQCILIRHLLSDRCWKHFEHF